MVFSLSINHPFGGFRRSTDFSQNASPGPDMGSHLPKDKGWHVPGAWVGRRSGGRPHRLRVRQRLRVLLDVGSLLCLGLLPLHPRHQPNPESRVAVSLPCESGTYFFCLSVFFFYSGFQMTFCINDLSGICTQNLILGTWYISLFLYKCLPKCIFIILYVNFFSVIVIL